MSDTHTLAFRLRHNSNIKIAVVGAGGNGSAVLLALPYLHQALLAWSNHQIGLDVTLIDGDPVSETNCVRQPFTRNEIGLNKATVLVSRVNLFWGLDWEAHPVFLSKKNITLLERMNFVIGCVDTKAGRNLIHHGLAKGEDAFADYWLDLGNRAHSGQFVLGQPRTKAGEKHLPTVAELYPESVDTTTPEDDLPSCSAEEALQRQEPFINQTLAMHALAMLTQLLRYNEISYHGGFVNAKSGIVHPIPVPTSDCKPRLHSIAPMVELEDTLA